MNVRMIGAGLHGLHLITPRARIAPCDTSAASLEPPSIVRCDEANRITTYPKYANEAGADTMIEVGLKVSSGIFNTSPITMVAKPANSKNMNENLTYLLRPYSAYTVSHLDVVSIHSWINLEALRIGTNL